MAQYRIKYSTILRKSKDVHDLAEDLNDEILKLEDLQRTLQREWAGAASDEFRAKLNSLIRNVGETRWRIENLSNTIRRVADRIQQEDERRIEKEKQKETKNVW